MKSIITKLRTRRLAGKMFSLAGLLDVLFFVFVYLFPWIKTDTGKAIGFACMAILVLYFVGIFIWLKRTDEPDAAEFFLLTAIPLSVIFLILIPPNCFVDSKTHVIAIYRLSNLLMGKGEWLSRADDARFINELWPEIAVPNTARYDSLISASSWLIKDDTLVDIIIHEDKMKFYSIVSYFPEVLGFTLARLLRLGTVPSLYLSRLFLNIFYIAVCTYAIKIMPNGKFCLAFTALLPESIHIAGAFSYDGMAVSCSLCFIACCFNVVDSVSRNGDRKSKILTKELIRCMIWSFILASVKGGGFFFLMIPLAFLSVSRKNARTFLRPMMIISAGLLSALIFNVIATCGISLFQLSGEEGYLNATFAFENPLSFLIMAAYAYVYWFELLFMGVTGGMMSWGDYVVPDVIMAVFVVLIFVFLVFEKGDSFSRKYKKYLVLSVIFFLLFTPVMLLSFTRTDSRDIGGLQGRYYTPLVPLVMIMITKFKIHRKALAVSDERIQIKIRKRLLIAATAFFCITVFYMLDTYLKR